MDGAEMHPQPAYRRRRARWERRVHGPADLYLLRAASRRSARVQRVDQLNRDVAIRDDRARIVAGLHETMIQRLFATGLTLHDALEMVTNPEVALRLEAVVAEMDETICDIRSAIFALGISGFDD